MKKPDAILSADLHIRPDKPRCRTEESFFETMDFKFTTVCKLANKYRCPLLIAGDLGNEPQLPNWLLRWFTYKIKKYNVEVVAIPGQHDLPYHRLRHWRKSAIGVLATAGVISLLGIKSRKPVRIKNFFVRPFPYGKPITKTKKAPKPLVAMSHQMVIDKKLWPEQTAEKGHVFLRRYPEYKLILTGDNHTPFVHRYEGRILVNPGSLLRQEADEADHEPRVYLWNADSNAIEPITIPIKKDVITREHIEEKQERDERLAKYVEKMKLSYKVGTSYEDNMKKYFRKNQPRLRVKRKVMEAME